MFSKELVICNSLRHDIFLKQHIRQTRLYAKKYLDFNIKNLNSVCIRPK